MKIIDIEEGPGRSGQGCSGPVRAGQDRAGPVRALRQSGRAIGAIEGSREEELFKTSVSEEEVARAGRVRRVIHELHKASKSCCQLRIAHGRFGQPVYIRMLYIYTDIFIEISSTVRLQILCSSDVQSRNKYWLTILGMLDPSMKI